MNLRTLTGALATILVLGFATESRADIIFGTGPGSLQPDEQLLFNTGGATGNPVQGYTNTTSTLFDIYSNETLNAAGGQAKVSAADGSYDLFFIKPNDPSVLFTEFRANVRIDTQASGTATVLACNQDGNFNGASFTPQGVSVGDGQPCESFSYSLSNGENVFVLSVADSQLLSGVKITTTTGIVDVRQIRVSPVSESGAPITPVPEPASLVLLGTGLFAGARAFRRRTA